MIDFSLGEDLEAVVEVARRLAREELGPRQREHEAARGVSAGLRRQAAGIGLDRIDWPEAVGGAALGALARVLVLETLAEGDPGATLALDGLGGVAQALHAFGADATLAACVAEFEQTPGARAVLVTDLDGRLDVTEDCADGTVPWIPADAPLLLAILGRDSLTLIREGLQVEPVRGSGLLAAGASRVVLRGAPVQARWSDPAAAARVLAQARLDAAALMVGQMSWALDYARRYALERVAFGKPIAHHQALAFLIVDLQMAVDGARAMLREAAWRMDHGHAFRAAAAAAYLEAIDAGRLVGPHGVQILGAAGFMRDHPVEKAMRELRTLALLAGGADAAGEDAWIDEAWGSMEADTPLPDRPVSLLVREA